MKLKSFRYIGPQALKSMRNNGWMTTAAILTITISLFLCSFFWLLLVNVDNNATKIEDDVRVMAYIDYSVEDDATRDTLEQAILAVDGVDEVEYIPKEEGIESIAPYFNNIDILSTLNGNNPLPDMFSITAQDAEEVGTIAAAVGELEGIWQVRYGEGTVEKLFAVTDTLRKVGIGVMALLAVAAIVLIAMAIRLTIMARRKEIMVMKWVGATDAFIRWPFFLEGLLLGLLGSILALTLVLLLYTRAVDFVSGAIPFAVVLPLADIWGRAVLFTLGSGLTLGAIGSLLPLTRFLDV